MQDLREEGEREEGNERISAMQDLREGEEREGGMSASVPCRT